MVSHWTSMCLSFCRSRRWLGVAKVLCILHHRGVQLRLAYSWARPAIFVAGKVEGECFYFFCFYTFIPVYIFSLSLSFISSTGTIFSISFLPFSGRWHKMTHKGWHVVRPQLNKICPSVSCTSLRLSICISFPYDNLSKHQWNFTKLGMCIDIVEIWFEIANGQISSKFEGSYLPETSIFFFSDDKLCKC